VDFDDWRHPGTGCVVPMPPGWERLEDPQPGIAVIAREPEAPAGPRSRAGASRLGAARAELTEQAGSTASDPTAAVVLVIEGSAHYVQWLGMPDDVLYLEASSTFAATQQDRLVALGWQPPRPKGPANTPNWNQYRVAPVDAAEAARTTVHTLAHVYGATPAAVQIDAVA
jgi:hypothetical protein